ncbi:unnamed protein product, partial [Hapterophycus canaliculatus]
RYPPERLDYVLFKALPPPLCAPQAVEPTWELSDCWVHRAYIPEQDADDNLLANSHSSPTATPGSPSTTVLSAGSPPQPRRMRRSGGDGPRGTASASSSPLRGSSGGDHPSLSGLSSPVRLRDGNLVDGVSVGLGAGVGGRRLRSSPIPRVKRINLSDHHGVAAEFIARDPETEDDDIMDEDMQEDMPREGMMNRLGSWHSQSTFGGNFPQGPLLARALAEIDRGIEEASKRRRSHLRKAKALAVLWVALVSGGAVTKSDTLIGYIARWAVGVLGGFVCAAVSALFLAYWFSAKEEMQGLKEVFQSATNYERHLPMEEAFPDGGFDTSQFRSYMEQNFR